MNIQFLKAIAVAEQAHHGQLRKDGHTTYVIHPLRVAVLVGGVTGWNDEDERIAAVTAALLHDVLEDSGTGAGSKRFTREDVSAEFGESITSVVSELTQDGALPKDERRRRMIEHCGQMSKMARVIKLADRLDNMLDMSDKDDSFIERYCAEAVRMVENMKDSHPPFEQEILRLIKVYQRGERPKRH